MNGDIDEAILFEQLADRSPEERAVELTKLSDTHPELAKRLRRLLDAHDMQKMDIQKGPARIESVPEHIGPYRVLERIGEGGMGDVYLCEQRQPIKRHLAVKVLKPGMDTRDVIARFDAERQALALMNHPNIAGIVDAGTTERGLPYFAMEYVPGIPLARYCEERSVPLEDRLKLFIQVCDAVQHAHQKGVIHRDLKPSNILVTDINGKPQPKIIDFGIAKAAGPQLTGHTLHTQIGQIVGTPEYMSPEQARLDIHDVDTRTDIYSLGVILYRLLAGRVPLSFNTRTYSLLEIHDRLSTATPLPPSRQLLKAGENDVDLDLHARQCGYPDAKALSQRLRRDLDWITMKALEKERSRRYATVAELAADITRHLNNQPVTAVRTSRAYLFGKFVRRHALASVSALAILVMLAGFTLYATWQARALSIERDKVAAEAERAKQVTRFLVDVFRSADPYGAGALATTADEILRRAMESLRNNPPASLATRAEIQRTLGEIRVNLGDYETGLALIDDALASAQHSYPADSETILSIRRLHAAALHAAGRFAESEEELRDVLAISEDRYGRENETWVMAARAHGATLLQMGRLQAAADRLEEALPITERVLGKDSFEALAVRNNLGVTYLRMNRMDEAEAMFEALHRDASRVFRPLHPVALGAAVNVSRIRNQQGDRQGAIEMLSGVLDAQTRILGANHPDTLSTRQNLAMLQPPDVFLAETREVLTTRKRVLGDAHPETLNSVINLAWALSATGASASEREALIVPALETLKQTAEPGDPLRQDAQLILAEIRTEQGRLKDAANLLTALADSGFIDPTLLDEPSFMPLWQQPEYAALRDRITGTNESREE